MATKKTIVLDVDASSAAEQLKKIQEELENIRKQGANTSDAIKDIGKNTEKSSKESVNALSKIGDGFKNLMKAAGVIGLIVTAFNFLKDVFMKNEKVAKTVEVVMSTISSVLSQMIDVVTNVYTRVSQLTNGFEGTRNVIGGLVGIIKGSLLTAFYSISLAVKEAQLGWEKSFFGKKDEKTIKELTSDIDGLKNKISESAQKVVDGSIKIVDNVGKAVGEFGNMVTGVYSGWSDISAKASYDAQKFAQEQAKNSALRAADIQTEIGKLEILKSEAEKIAENENLSYEARKKGAADAIKITEDLIKKQTELGNAKVAQAKAEAVANNYNTESLIKIREAEAARDAAIASATEQNTNAQKVSVALTNEEIAANEALRKGYEDLDKKQRDFSTGRIKNEEERLNSVLNNLTIEKSNLETWYSEQKDKYKDNSDKLKEIDLQYKTFKEDLNQKEVTTNDQKNKLIFDNKKAYLEAELQLSKDNLDKNEDGQLKYLNKILELDKDKLKNFQGTEEERLALETKISNDIIAIHDEETNKKLGNIAKVQEIASQSAQVISDISSTWANISEQREKKKLESGKITQEQYEKNIADIKLKAARREKALNVGQAIMNTILAISKANTLTPPANIPAMILAGVIGAAQVAKLISTPVEGGSGGGGGGTSVPSATSPSTAPQTSFSFVPTNPTPTQPILKTYVISKDVETQQQLDRQTISNGTI